MVPPDLLPISPSVPAPSVPVMQLGKGADAVSAQKAPVVKEPEKLRIDPVAMRKTLQEVAEMLNQQIGKYDSNLGFSVDKVANVHVVTVINKESGEVIRTIPGEAFLRIAHSIESLKGILYNQTI